MNKQDWIEKLSLVEHVEGGYFSESYRSAEKYRRLEKGRLARY